jgi:large subunit ribosomal protein L21
VAYAIVRAGGKQFRVTEGEVIQIPSIKAEVGSSVGLEVMLQGDAEAVNVSSASLSGHSVTATVVEHGRGQKVIVFKKKRRKQYKKTRGHRQNYTAVKIESIS